MVCLFRAGRTSGYFGLARGQIEDRQGARHEASSCHTAEDCCRVHVVRNSYWEAGKGECVGQAGNGNVLDKRGRGNVLDKRGMGMCWTSGEWERVGQAGKGERVGQAGNGNVLDKRGMGMCWTSGEGECVGQDVMQAVVISLQL